MPATSGIRVRGLRELQTALAHAQRDTRLGVRREFRDLAEPIRREAETLARARIPRIGQEWPLMRTGVTRRAVYVAPKQRGARGAGNPLRRPNFAGLLMDRAMQPALERHQSEITGELERTFDRIADNFNRGGAL